MKQTINALSFKVNFLAFIVLVNLNSYVHAKAPGQVKFSVERTENMKPNENLVLPYVFSSDDLGAIWGLGGMITGVHQKQLTVGATVFGGEKSKGIGVGLWDYALFDSNRLYVSAIGMMGKYPLLRAYSPLPDEVTPQGEHRPGSNDSRFDDFIESKGSNNWWDIKLEYVLPIGHAKEKGMAIYKLNGGLLVDNAEVADWNPLQTGTTVIVARQFNRYQLYNKEEGDIEGAVHAFELGILYDNTDFPINPSQGSAQYLAFTYNPKWLESKSNWTNVEFEASKYFSFGENSFAKQNILAVNMWVSYSPSWNLVYDEQGNSMVESGPPFLEGSTLGGMYRMRGFRQNRFHDKAAIYATAEYRMTMKYNPVEDVNWLNFLNLDWFQTVLYVEGGRVAPTFTSKDIFRNWKSDVGISLRALTAGMVVRMDVTASQEDTVTWFMIEHPF